MTYRERREARAERLQGWADKREVKARNGYETATNLVKDIPFGQPILLGHHSQRRAERTQERFVAGVDRSIADKAKADEMRAKAANILSAADRAIYSDDPDAIEALTTKIAQLEDRRTDIKETNAEFKATHKAELKAETNSYLRDCMMPHPSYELTNLTGNINRQKKRLAQLERAK